MLKPVGLKPDSIRVYDGASVNQETSTHLASIMEREPEALVICLVKNPDGDYTVNTYIKPRI